MASSKKIKFDVYRVSIEDDPTRRLEEIFKAIRRLPADDESRTIERQQEGDAFRVQYLAQSKGYWIGDAIRIRMTAVPVVTSLVGRSQPIDLEDDEGIGEETIFLYDEQNRFLLLQRNRSGVSASALSMYLGQMGSAAVQLYPVPRRDALERLANLGHVRRFELHLADLDTLQLGPTDGFAASTLGHLAQEMAAPSISIVVSLGHRDGSIRNGISAAKQALALAKRAGDHVTKIQIAGRVKDTDETDVIDLLVDRFVVETEVPLTGRTVSLQSREAAARRVYSEILPELLSSITSKPS